MTCVQKWFPLLETSHTYTCDTGGKLSPTLNNGQCGWGDALQSMKDRESEDVKYCSLEF